jgi:endoglucanase
MNQKLILLIIIFIIVLFFLFLLDFLEMRKETEGAQANYCLTGAFIADQPTKENIENFKNNYGKKPYLVMVFIDWGNFIEEDIYKNIFAASSVPFITWEPWNAETKEGINFNKILNGDYDPYIIKFAKNINKFNKPVFLRFGHEVNGNWYPWSGEIITANVYIKTYRYIKNLFDNITDDKVEWVFSINWEDLPPSESNFFMNYYPGPGYVDYFGIDGYNWGDTRKWSHWLEFAEMFKRSYQIVTSKTNKPIIISEFGSAQSGGNKAKWIKDAFKSIKKMKRIKAFVLFNLDKEADWRFRPQSEAGKQFRKELKSSYFKENWQDE